MNEKKNHEIITFTTLRHDLQKKKDMGTKKCTHWFEHVLLLAIVALHEFHKQIYHYHEVE